jgi:hypothetical protein
MFTHSGKEVLRLHEGQNIWDHSEGCDKKTSRWLSFIFLTLPFESGHAIYNTDISNWLLIKLCAEYDRPHSCMGMIW